MIEVRCAAELGEPVRARISEIFVEGFGEHLRFFSKERSRLAKPLEHMFMLDVFYVAVTNGEIAGIAALAHGHAHAVGHSRKELVRHLGWIKGTMANMIFNREFRKPPVVTGTALRKSTSSPQPPSIGGKAPTRRSCTICLHSPHSTNSCWRLPTPIRRPSGCTRGGFKEFKRIKHQYSRVSGVNHLVYMKYTKPAGISG